MEYTDLGQEVQCGLLLTKDGMIVVGNKKNFNTLVFTTLMLLPKRHPEIFAKIQSIAKEDQEYAYEYLSRLESKKE